MLRLAGRNYEETPVVANYFYPGDKATLSSMLEELIEFSEEKLQAKGIVVPHAGYIYSGKVAGKVYGRIVPLIMLLFLGPIIQGLELMFPFLEERPL